MAKVKKVKKVKKAKKTKAAGVVTVTLPGFDKMECEILNISSNGMFVKRKRPRSSKWEKLFIPAGDLVAYAKGAGKKAPDVVIRKSSKAIVLSGKTESMSAKGDTISFTLEGTEWVVLQGDIEYAEALD